MANGTQTTQNPSPPSLLEKLRGKRTSDIYLPQEGRRDPRLGKPTVGDRLMEARERLKAVGSKRAASARGAKRNGRR